MGKKSNFDNVVSNAIYSYTWIKPYHVLTDDEFQVIFDLSHRKGRFLLFNVAIGYLSYLGETAQEAVEIYNFPDMSSEKLIDDITGDVTTLSVVDPDLDIRLAKELNCVPLSRPRGLL